MAVGAAILQSRKGIFMTAIAVVVMILLFSWAKLTAPNTNPNEVNMQADRIRIITMNKYLDVLEKHISNSMSVAGYLALQNISEKIRTGEVNITTSNFNGAMYNCLWLNSTSCMRYNETLNYSINNLTILAKNNLNINTQYKINSITIQDSKPFQLMVIANVSYSISDNSANDIATWNATSIINTTIDVEGIKDPLYMYYYQNGSFNDSQRVFSKTSIRVNQFNNTVFTNQFHPRREYIAKSGEGLSVMQRFTKNWSVQDSNNGITSIITVGELNLTKYNNTARQNLSMTDRKFVNGIKYNCKNAEVVGLNGLTGQDAYARIDIATLTDTFDYDNYNSTEWDSIVIESCIS